MYKIYTPTPGLDYPPDAVFKGVCPIQEIPEAGIHWLKKFYGYYKKDLGPKPSTFDFCVMYSPICMAF